MKIYRSLNSKWGLMELISRVRNEGDFVTYNVARPLPELPNFNYNITYKREGAKVVQLINTTTLTSYSTTKDAIVEFDDVVSSRIVTLINHNLIY